MERELDPDDSLTMLVAGMAMLTDVLLVVNCKLSGDSVSPSMMMKGLLLFSRAKR